MYYFDTLPPVSPACWSPDSGITLEEAAKFFKAYKREVRIFMNECKEANFYPYRFIWRELRLEEEYVKEEEKCMTSDEKGALSIEEFEVNKKYWKGERRKLKDDIVLDESENITIYEDVDIQKQNLQRKCIPKNYFNSKADERQEINKVLDVIYALFTIIKLKIIWMHHHLYLKFITFLPNKRKKER